MLDYIKSLKDELKRFKQIDKYKEQMEKAKTEKKKNYYLEGMKALMIGNETPENYERSKQEYINAYNKRKEIVDNLVDEIKIIKKLKV